MESKKILDTSFLIVGAGPSGLLLGIQLRRLGLETKIIERSLQQSRPVCGEYLSPQGVEYLKNQGLGHLLRDFNVIKGMVLYSAYETKVTTLFPENKYGVAVHRGIFQERLAKEFESLGGDIFYGNAVDEIKSNEGGYEVLTSQLTIKTNYVIGADGRQSKVARLLDFATAEPFQKRLALHCYLKPKSPLAQLGQMHILPDGSYVGINPISDEEVNFSIVTTHEAIKDAGGVRPLINFWLEERLGLKKQFSPIIKEEIKTTGPLNRSSIEIAKGRAVLIGDASGFIDPLTGEGITTAIKTAFILADEIKNSKTVEVAFQNYSYRRKNDFSEKERLNFGFQKIIRSPLSCEIIAQVLNLSDRLKNTFIGVIGNIYTPKEGVKVLFNLYLQERN